MQRRLVMLIVGLLLALAVVFGVRRAPTTSPKAGCCSHHGGVCGCSQGRAKCCDGTKSPSCDC